MRKRAYRPNLVGPLILISIGVLLLLNQMGWLRWDILWSLWRYWPVILILLGVEVLLGISQSRVLYLLGLLIAIAVLAGLFGYAMLQGAQVPAERPASDTAMLSRGLEDAERGLVTLRLGAGTLNLGALVDSSNLVEAKVAYAEQSRKVQEHFAMTNGQAEFELRGSQENFLWMPSGKMNETWQLHLTQRVPLELRIEMGAGSVQADLSDLKITQLDVNMGAGDIVLTLPAAEGTASASVKLAVGELTVLAPSGVGVRIRANRLLSSVNIDERRFTRSGNDWVSDNYGSAAMKVDLQITNVIGTINVR